MQRVLTGIDNIDTLENLISGKKVALLTNPTGVNAQLISTIDILKDYGLCLLFAPEHGVRGDKQAGDKVETFTDEKTGICVYSLYGQTKSVPAELNDRYDILIYDIQDVGSRYYTYVSSLLNCIKSCAENKKTLIILDRPNPINANDVEGHMLQKELISFVGCFEMPQRYGLTIGEFAFMANEVLSIGCDLSVVKMTGYDRNMYFDETGLPMVMPSPNIPTLDTMLLYNGTCLFEGTVMSEGRGTTKPFEIIGAPWLDAEKITDIMNDKKLPGVMFRPIYFTPTFSKHKGELCAGVNIHITDRRKLKPVELGIHMLYEIKKLCPLDKFFLSPPFESDDLFIDKLAGTKALRQDFEPEALLEKWRKESIEFKKMSEKFLLY